MHEDFEVSSASRLLQVERQQSMKACKATTEVCLATLRFQDATDAAYIEGCSWLGAPCAFEQVSYGQLLRDLQVGDAGDAQVLASSEARLHKQGTLVSDDDLPLAIKKEQWYPWKGCNQGRLHHAMCKLNIEHTHKYMLQTTLMREQKSEEY